MSKYLNLIIFIIICEVVGLAGTPFTFSSIQTWYMSLNKPTFSPPNWIFGPVWTILYLMMGVSSYLVWEKGLKSKKVKTALYFFLVQLFLNFIWSLLFFGLRSPVFGFVDIILLWLMILFTIMKFYRISRFASYLLIPYLVWVSFASILNFSIIVLNP